MRRRSARSVQGMAYPLVWGLGQLFTGWLSDSHRPQAADHGRHARPVRRARHAGGRRGQFHYRVACRHTALHPHRHGLPDLDRSSLDVAQPRDRARIVGVYRFWRDFGFAIGALAAGILTDLVSADAAIGVVAVLTAASGLVVDRNALDWPHQTRSPGGRRRSPALTRTF